MLNINETQIVFLDNGAKMKNDILIQKKQNILDITFNRPESRNAINRDMFEKLLSTLEKSKLDKDLKAVFLSGKGDSFSAGGDVKDMAKNKDKENLHQKTISLRRIMEVSKLLYSLPVPTVSIITGPAAGAGFSLALACDMRIATQNAKFTTAFAKVGFSGDFGGSFFLTKLIGTAKARELYYFSDVVDAEQAKKLGILNYLVEKKDLNRFSKNLKQKFRELPPIAVRFMKKNLNNAELESLDLCLDEEAIHMMICSETQDHKNAVKAFVAKKRPKFIGK